MADKERIARLKQVQKIVSKLPFQTLLIEHATDIFYLTGLTLSKGMLLIDNRKSNLIVDGRYYEMATKKSPCPVTLLKKDALKDQTGLGFCQEHTSYARFLELKKISKKPTPIANPIDALRQIKDASELKKLKKAAILGSQGFRFVRKNIKQGITESQLALELEIFWKKRGIEDISFSPIVAFGENSAIPHHHPGSRRLKPGDTVLIDLGVKWQGYCSDMTRTFFFGKPPQKMREIYSIVLQAQENALKRCRAGASIETIERAAKETIERAGYTLPHGLGHGIGLDIHEQPFITQRAKNTRLKRGMVITIEPGIYLPKIGGVRIEDSLIIESQGHAILTHVSKKLDYVKL